YLNLPGRGEEAGQYDVSAEDSINNQKSVFEGIDPATGMAVDFNTDALLINGKNYGAWQFEMRPVDDGLVLKNLRADVRQMRVGGLNREAGPTGAEFIWLQKNGADSSQFIGTLSAGNIANVLAAWDMEKLMESQTAQVNLATRWQGAPDEVTFENITGLVSLDFRNGNFIRGAQAGENP